MKKILILSANPKDTNKLRLDEEVREIQAALQRAQNREQFEIITEWAVRVDDLRRALLDCQPTIVHFSGHGLAGDGLALEDRSGQMQLVSAESLAKLFKLFQGKVECVLLNACYSEAQAEAIHQHIDYVIGMNRGVGDVAAIEFAVGFYDALGTGRPYEDCFEVGCASISLQGIPESSTPVLKARRQRSQTELELNSGNAASMEPPAGEYPTSNDKRVEQDRSVSIGGNVTGSVIQTGDRNVASVRWQTVSLPNPESVDMRAELNALRKVLADLVTPDRRKIDNAFSDTEDELNKPNPDKDEVGRAVDRALEYAKKAEGFIGVIEKLKPHVTQTAAWLGENWHQLLSIVNLAL